MPTSVCEWSLVYHTFDFDQQCLKIIHVQFGPYDCGLKVALKCSYKSLPKTSPPGSSFGNTFSCDSLICWELLNFWGIHKFSNFVTSKFARLNVLALSNMINRTSPLFPIKRLKALMLVSTFMSVTNFKCTPLIAAHVNSMM